jgi:hypothetical protein
MIYGTVTRKLSVSFVRFSCHDDLPEGGLRVPMMVMWKNHIPAGKILRGIQAHMDILQHSQQLHVKVAGYA